MKNKDKTNRSENGASGKFSGKSALTVTVMMGATVVAKLLGMLRSMIMASAYGISEEAQAFTAASHIPLTLFDLAFGAAILGCFIPVYNSCGDDKIKVRFADVFFSTVITATSFLALIGILFSDGITAVMIPGADAGIKALASKLLRIMFPMIVATGATYTLVGIMQSKGRYLLPAVVSAVSNAGVVIYLLFINDRIGDKGIYGLAAAYLCAWILQLLTLAVPLAGSGWKFRFALDFRNEELIHALKMTPGIMFGSWLTPLSVQLGLFFASFVDTDGAVTMFDYSYATFALIAGILTYSICNYAFPLLSRAEGEEWNAIVRTGIKTALAIVLPFTGAGMLLSEEIIKILYMRRSFDVNSALYTAQAMKYMLIALPSFALVEVLSRVFYSKKNPLPPAIAAASGIAVNILLSVIILTAGRYGIEAMGICYSAGITAAAAVLIVFLIKKAYKVFDISFICDIIKLAVCAAAAAAAMYFISRSCGAMVSGVSENVFVSCFAKCLAVFIPGAAVYAVMLALTGVYGKKRKQ